MSLDVPANTVSSVRLAGLVGLPAEAPIQLDELARILNRHPTSIKRAVKRGELPHGVLFMGKKTWTSALIMAHLNRRFGQAAKDAEKYVARLSDASPQGGR